MRRLATATLAALILVPASAQASDPLLSGYGGPGGGEQVVLGSKLVGGSNKKASGSLRAASAPAQRTATAKSSTAGTAAKPAATAVATAVRKATKGSSRRGRSGGTGTGAGSGAATKHSRVALPAGKSAATAAKAAAQAGVTSTPMPAATAPAPQSAVDAERAADVTGNAGGLGLRPTDIVLLIGGLLAAVIAGTASTRVQRAPRWR